MKQILTYRLKIFPNFHKSEDMKYSASRYSLYLQHFTTQLYYRPVRFLSTQGMGKLANQAQKQAIGIVKGEKEALKEREIKKTSCPQISFQMTPGRIEKSKHTAFDYWITLTSQWKNKIKIPANSHTILSQLPPPLGGGS